MPTVLCFDCGGSFEVSYETANPTKKCPKCHKIKTYNEVSKEFSIVTLPRSGSYYLQDRILQHTGVYVKKYHTVKNNRMITIVRDPIDMLTSKLAMTAFFDKNNETINEIKNNKVTRDLEEYDLSLKKVNIDKDFYIIIDYKDLINYPFETTLAVSNMMDLPIINKEYVDSLIERNLQRNHLISSKSVPCYEEIRSYVEQLDLSESYKFYNLAISNCIKIL
jgi:hypothetical protein